MPADSGTYRIERVLCDSRAARYGYSVRCHFGNMPPIVPRGRDRALRPGN